MKFGIFYEHQLPKPWTEDSEYDLFHQSLEQIELADQAAAMTTPGRSSTTSSRSTRTRRRRKCSSVLPASGRRTSGSATASCS
ncbi:MAG: hypothetical protein U5R31_17550 [Acidimicrobiia bacterium]|nr:hypothetical protein [Acidimicrobiia bacterium]